ncbi:MAG: hypothetical protein HY870_20600 [Chloroflexi bacterium]|nr:hypothetical protein [Chloroflexota bacterium]
MLKKVLMGMLAVVVIGAVVVGVADALTGKSVAAQSVAAQGAVQSTAAQTATQTQAVAGNGQGQAQGQGYRGGQDTTTNGQGGQGTTTNPNPGTPQANITQTVTIAGVVQSFDGVGISLITDDGAPLWVQLGQSRYISAQGVTFTANDHVTATGFYENGQFQASSVVNATTGQTLTLRDASGRPLWAGGAGGKGNH